MIDAEYERHPNLNDGLSPDEAAALREFLQYGHGGQHSIADIMSGFERLTPRMHRAEAGQIPLATSAQLGFVPADSGNFSQEHPSGNL